MNLSESVANWFRNNNMIVNQDKFQLMLLQKSTRLVIQEKLHIDSNETESENSVTLLGLLLTIGYHLMAIFQNDVTKHPCN